MILAHLSDPHLPTPPGSGGLAAKQLLGRLAWRRKRHVHSPEVLCALMADVAAHRPDHICLTGDLINTSTPAELAAARDWLEGVAPPHDLTVSPGNHDLLVARAPDPWRAWRPWMEDAPGPFPGLRVRGRLALVNLCSATPTPLFSARGALGDAQLAALEAVLQDTAARGLHRVVLAHHPVAPGAPRRKALADAAGLAAVLARAGAELVLHGHLHRAGLASIAGPAGPIPVIGAPSASSSRTGAAAARWNAIALVETPAGLEISVSARSLGRDGAMTDLGGYVIAPQCT